MIDLEHELRELYADTDDDHLAAERIRAALATRRRSRASGWMVAAAATAAACVAAGTFALRAHDRQVPGAGAAPPSCTASLPAEWRHALGTTPVTVDGVAASPILLTSTGDVVVGWQPDGGTARIGVTSADGTTRTLLRTLGDHLGGGYALEGNTLVVGPTSWGTSLAVVDVRSGSTREISLVPAMPAGYQASDGVAILDGVIYFGASPRRDGTGGVIVGYDLASGMSHIAARTDGPVFVRQDARGVLWANGGIRATGTPTSVPSSSTAYSVDGDGANYAWNGTGPTSHRITWTDGAGSTRMFTVALPHHPRAQPIVMAVSGPFVLLSPYSGTRPLPGSPAHLAVLDTRTGAVADLGVPLVDSSAAGGRDVLAFTNGADATLRIATVDLPDLTC